MLWTRRRWVSRLLCFRAVFGFEWRLYSTIVLSDAAVRMLRMVQLPSPLTLVLPVLLPFYCREIQKDVDNLFQRQDVRGTCNCSLCLRCLLLWTASALNVILKLNNFKLGSEFEVALKKNARICAELCHIFQAISHFGNSKAC